MWETLSSYTELFTVLVPPLWVGLAVCVGWFFFAAKRAAPMTHEEAKMLWTLHKQEAECGACEYQEIEKRHRTVGFRCECGYKHLQERPMV
jgi:hypothetical protein